MTQYGFFIDLSRCTGCNACVISCKQWHDIAPGPVKWMRVYQWEKGAFPDIDLRVLPIMCFHCENPVCAASCPNGAIYKDEKYGAVLVDLAKCKGERKCWEACPYGTPQFEGDESGLKMSKCNMCIERLEQGLKPICVLSCSLRALEFGPLDELRQKFSDAPWLEDMSRDCAPCRVACPARVNAQGYVELIARGEFGEAIELFRENNPFAGVLGRVCTHPCEVNCQRGKFDDSVAIRSLKRFMADNELGAGTEKARPAQITRVEKVAVIGSGPAGLACAYDLIGLGYPVTVFEVDPQSGGLLRYGIPEYRLPKKVLDAEIGYIEELGVVIKNSTPVGQLEDIFEQGYQVVFMASGAGVSQKLGVPGEDNKGVIYALDFLRRVNSGMKVEIGQRVAVIGGGSVAIDAARVARRLGATEVHLICLECRDLASRDRMLAQDREIEEAEEEEVTIHPCLGVRSILGQGGVVIGLETVGCVSVYDEDGTFAPKFDGSGAPTMAVDNVIVAIGQTVDKSGLPVGLEYTAGGTVAVDPVTLETSIKGVFAGGDIAAGAADVVSAIAAGKEAAISIDRYIRGVDIREGRRPPYRGVKGSLGIKGYRPPALEVEKRKGFVEVALGLDEETAVEQANRCLHCGHTVPSVLFKPVDPKRQIIPWDCRRALELWQHRHPDGGETLPDVFADISDVTRDPESIIGRNRLVLKAKSTEELMYYTTDDE